MPVLRYFAFHKEASYGESPAPVATRALDIASATLDVPTDPELIYGGGLGRMAKTKRPGFYAPSGNIVCAFDIHSIAHFLKWALGGYTYTVGAGGATNKHECYGTDNLILPSFNARLGRDEFEHMFYGCSLNGLTLNIDGEYAMATLDVMAQKDEKVAIKTMAAVIALLPAQYPLAFHEVTATIGGSDVSAKVRTLEFSIANNLSAEAGRSIGSRHPRRMISGERKVSFSMGLYFDGTAQLERFWGSATGPDADGQIAFATTINLSAGADGSAAISLPACIMTDAKQPITGRGEISHTISATALQSDITLVDTLTHVYSEILATITNAGLII